MDARSGWTLLSNHANVTVALAQNPELRLRDLAEQVGITERAVAQIIVDLEAAGVISRGRDGRRNVYTVHRSVPLRHPLEKHRAVGDILSVVVGRA